MTPRKRDDNNTHGREPMTTPAHGCASQMLLVNWIHEQAMALTFITREDVEDVIAYHAQRGESFDALKPLLAAVTAHERLLRKD
jgi:hypothetical protein